jgi:hypothetical protein
MYSKTVASRSKTNSPPPKHLYVAPDILEKTWAPLPVIRNGRLHNPWRKRVTDLGKASAAHVKEGLIYESRAVIWNNPLRPVEISGWGFLNNISGGTANTRNAGFKAALDSIKSKIAAHLNKEFPPLPPGAAKKNTNARESKIKKYQSANPIWKYPSEELTKRGHDYVRVLMKRSGYFVAPKFSTLELRDDPIVFGKGKGDNFIELDGLIHDVKSNKFIILELKKGYGKKGEEEAQQMRKAAALLRKWSYEINGTVPTIELYFAAGAATNYKNYEFNSEINGGSVQDYSSSQIRRMISAKPNHLVYVRTPVNLLLGVGLANLLRIDPRRVRNIVNSLANTTGGWNASSNYLGRLRTSSNKIIPFLYYNSNLTRKANANNAKKNTGSNLYFNVKNFALKNPNFLKLIPNQWHPKAKNKPTNMLARVSEDILYIKGREEKLAKTNDPKIRKDIVSHIQLLLSNKYKNYVKPSTREKLTAKLARYGGNVLTKAPSPERTTKYYSRVLKARQIAPTKYFKRETGEYKKKPAGKSVKFGAGKVRPEAILPEYEFGRKRPGYNVGNFTVNNVRNMSNENVLRRLTVLGVRATGASTQVNKNTAIRFAQSVINAGNKDPRIVNKARQQIRDLQGQYGGIVKKQAPAPSNSTMNVNAAKKILKRAREELNNAQYKSAFPRGAASVAKYVRETAPGKSVINFAKTVNRPGSIRPR